MKYLAALALVLAACPNADTDDYPVLPNAGTRTPTGAPNLIFGRVCVLVDARVFATCTTFNLLPMTVKVGASSTTTNPDGTFVLPAPQGSNLAFTVTGPNIVTSTQPFSVNNTIPVVPQDLFGQMLTANGITLTAGSGSVLASVVSRGGVPVSGVTAVSTPSPAFGPFFDGTTPTSWTLNGTGSRGIVWLPGVNAGAASLTLNDVGSSGETTVDGIQVIDGGITFVDAVLP